MPAHRPSPAHKQLQGTERIFHTNAEPSTVITATDKYRVGYPPSWLTNGAAIAGASTCGPELAMLMMPRSLARPAERQPAHGVDDALPGLGQPAGGASGIEDAVRRVARNSLAGLARRLGGFGETRMTCGDPDLRDDWTPCFLDLYPTSAGEGTAHLFTGPR